MRILDGGERHELVEPSQLGITDRIELWHRLSSTIRMPVTKTLVMWSIWAMRRVTGMTMIPTLLIAIRKVR